MKIASIADVKARFSAFIKESESGPVVITRNGKPAAILLNVVDEDEIEGLILAYSPKFRAILQAAREEIKQTGGIPEEEFWQEVDAAYENGASNGHSGNGVNGKASGKRRRKAAEHPLHLTPA
jgi:prevent-host-death family protein